MANRLLERLFPSYRLRQELTSSERRIQGLHNQLEIRRKELKQTGNDYATAQEELAQTRQRLELVTSNYDFLSATSQARAERIEELERMLRERTETLTALTGESPEGAGKFLGGILRLLSGRNADYFYTDPNGVILHSHGQIISRTLAYPQGFFRWDKKVNIRDILYGSDFQVVQEAMRRTASDQSIADFEVDVGIRIQSPNTPLFTHCCLIVEPNRQSDSQTNICAWTIKLSGKTPPIPNHSTEKIIEVPHNLNPINLAACLRNLNKAAHSPKISHIVEIKSDELRPSILGGIGTLLQKSPSSSVYGIHRLNPADYTALRNFAPNLSRGQFRLPDPIYRNAKTSASPGSQPQSI